MDTKLPRGQPKGAEKMALQGACTQCWHEGFGLILDIHLPFIMSCCYVCPP